MGLGLNPSKEGGPAGWNLCLQEGTVRPHWKNFRQYSIAVLKQNCHGWVNEPDRNRKQAGTNGKDKVLYSSSSPAALLSELQLRVGQ